MNIDLTPIVMVGEQQAGESARLRQQLVDLIETVNKSSFDIGEVAHRVKQSGDYGGHTTFQEFGRTLKIKPSRLLYLTKIASTMEQLGIPRSEYEPVGITKLRQITSLTLGEVWKNPDTGEETPISEFITGLIQRGTTLSADEISQHVRILKGQIGDNDFVRRTYSMLRSVAEQTVDPAIELAKRGLGTRGRDDEGIAKEASDGAALEVISVSFLNDPTNGSMFEPLTEAEESDTLEVGE